MESNNSKSAMGDLVISDEVISSIAMNAAKDVEGVSSFCSKPVDVIKTVKNGSMKFLSPVRINGNGDELVISVYINLLPNTKFQGVARNVQQAVKESIQNMTGKYVSKVNVIATGVDFDDSPVKDDKDNENN